MSVPFRFAAGALSPLTLAACPGGVTTKGAGGGYSQTPEGQAVVAAFTDAFNNLVVAARNYEAQDVEGGLGTGGQLQVN